MSKALREIGVRRAVGFGIGVIVGGLLRLAAVPQLRVILLRLCGARIGRNTIIHRFSFINFYRGGFRALRVGNNCFVGDETMLDLAAPVTLEDHVTLSSRVTILTHLNVGYADHPLQARFPAHAAPVHLKTGCFVGACATILAGVTLGERAFVGAASLVVRDVPPDAVVGGVPARPLRADLAAPEMRT